MASKSRGPEQKIVHLLHWKDLMKDFAMYIINGKLSVTHNYAICINWSG